MIDLLANVTYDRSVDKDRLRRPGKVRSLSGVVTMAEFQAAINAGPGTVELHSVTCDTSSATGLVLAPYVAVIDMTGDSLLRVNFSGATFAVQMNDTTRDAVWCCDIDANGSMAANASVLAYSFKNNLVEGTKISGDTGAVAFGSRPFGRGKCSIVRCEVTGMYRAIRHYDTTLENVTLYRKLNYFHGNIRNDEYIITDQDMVSIKLLDKHDPPNSSAQDFQHSTHLWKNSTEGRFVAGSKEIGTLYSGNGEAQTGTANGACSDMSSWTGTDGLYRGFIICFDGGESALTVTGSSTDCITEYCTLVNIDAGAAMGSSVDNGATKNSNMQLKSLLAIACARDRANEFPTARSSVYVNNCEGLAITDLVVINDQGTKMIAEVVLDDSTGTTETNTKRYGPLAA